MKTLMLLLIVSLCSVSVLANGAPGAPEKTIKVNIFLIALNDDGYSGTRVGCGDSLVKEERTVAWTATPLKAAIEELLSVNEPIKRRVDLELNNYWKGTDLKLESAVISRGTAIIKITGQLVVAGVCDQPRIEGQINATAKQFKSVKRVLVYVNGQRLKDAIR